MSSDAQIRASVAHNKKMGSITIRPPKEVDSQIRAAAKQAGESLSEYILKAVQARMEQEQTEQWTGGYFHFSGGDRPG